MYQIAQFRGLKKMFPRRKKLLRSLRGDVCQTQRKLLKKVLKVGKKYGFPERGGGDKLFKNNKQKIKYRKIMRTKKDLLQKNQSINYMKKREKGSESLKNYKFINFFRASRKLDKIWIPFVFLT